MRRLVLVGGPIDTATAESQLSRFVAGVPFSMFEELVRLGEGLVEGERTLKAWGLSDDFNEAETVLQNPPNTDPVRRRELADRYGKWYGETVNLPGVFYLQVVKWLFKENQVAEARFVALGQCVDLMSIRVPIFLLAAGNDEIVPAGQLFATARLVGTPAKQLVEMTEPCGHLSLFLGAVVLDEAWRNIARWLGHDLSDPQIDLPRAVVR